MKQQTRLVPQGYVALADVLDIAATRTLEPYFDLPFGPRAWLRNRKLFRFLKSIPTTDTYYNGIFLRLLEEIGSMGRAGHLEVFYWDDEAGVPDSLDKGVFSEPLTFGHETTLSGDGNSNFVLQSLGGKIPILPRNSAFLECVDALLLQVSGIAPPWRKPDQPGCYSGSQWEHIAGRLPYWPLDFASLAIDLHPDIDAAISKYAAYLEYGGRKFAQSMSDRHLSGYMPYITNWARIGLISVFGTRGGGRLAPEQPQKIEPLEWLDLHIQFVNGLGYIASYNRGDASDTFWHDLAVSRTSLSEVLGSAPDGQRPRGRPLAIRQAADAAVRDLYPPAGKRPKGISQDAAHADVNVWLKKKGLAAVSKDTVLRALGERKN